MSTDVQLKTIREHTRKEIFLGLARVPGSARVILSASDGNLYDVEAADAEKPEFKAWTGHTSFVTSVAIAGEMVVSGGYDCQLLWRKLSSGELVHQMAGAHARWIRKIVASPDGRLLASVGDDMVCRVWDSASGKLVHELRGHDERTPSHFPSMLYTAAFSSDGRLATADKVGRICLWDVDKGTKLAQFDGSGFYTWDPRQRIHSIGGIRALAFSPDNKWLAVGGIGTIGNVDHLDGPARVELFDVEKTSSLHVFTGETKGLVEHLVFDPEQKWLLAFGGDNGGAWQALDLLEKKIVRAEKAPMHVHFAVLSEDAKRLFAVGHGKLLVYGVAS